MLCVAVTQRVSLEGFFFLKFQHYITACKCKNRFGGTLFISGSLWFRHSSVVRGCFWLANASCCNILVFLNQPSCSCRRSRKDMMMMTMRMMTTMIKEGQYTCICNITLMFRNICMDRCWCTCVHVCWRTCDMQLLVGWVRNTVKIWGVLLILAPERPLTLTVQSSKQQSVAAPSVWLPRCWFEPYVGSHSNAQSREATVR